MASDLLDGLAFTEELVALGQFADDLLGRVPASFHVVWSSFPHLWDWTRTTGGSAHGDPANAGNSFAYSFHCFTSQVWIGGCRGGPGEADAGVRARSDSPWSPGALAPDSSTHSRLQVQNRRPHRQHFIRQG